MNYVSFENRVHSIASRVEQLGGEVGEVTIAEPASSDEVLQMEKRLGISLPKSYKRVLLEYAGEFSFYWSLPDEMERPHEFREIFSGTVQWSLTSLPRLEEERKEWINVVFPDVNDPYDVIWHDKLAFCEVDNGDYLAFDLSDGADDAPVVYLSHDDGDGHGYRLANNFIELIEHASRLGFVGCEDFRWLPFTTSSTSGILADGEAAIRFRRWLELEV
ncbi:SMI1/KNR4 family protein [Exiguobacterium alkaliphilum]|uniref:SMI1/KNR4 family protein n=1 Tax=Exiguobacterium alkaliphilum TaxID=1428684 RepID=UPI001BA44D73|nr:SMI1/KNR4 family protein [Exiguobacterium alkaliphilum]QUE87319.1 SMI1/KNR4 family protein [Exiguobacterium alkaliphilum]